MDHYAQLELSWSVGYNGSQLHYVTDNILVYGCGNTLSFVRDDGVIVRSLQSEGKGVGFLTTCHKTQVVAYAEATLRPRIFVIDYPICECKYILEGGACLKYTSFSFSRDGKKLVTLSGCPDFRMVVWNCFEFEGCEICSVNIEEGGNEVSVNPMNWKQFFVLGPSRLTLWEVEQCGLEFILTPIEVCLPGKIDEVGTRTRPNIQYTKSPKMVSTTVSTICLYTPPNMSEVYFKGSYQDFIKHKQLVVPTSLCWTPLHSVYVGCDGGQLLLVKSDTGKATLLINPQPSLDDLALLVDSSSLSLVKTAHSMLKEGSSNCLLFGHRGLFTASKDGLIQCFSTGDMELKEELDIKQPIKHICWSPDCVMMAIGTEHGSICVTDPSSLTASLVTIVDHCCTKLTGLDVLCPGSEFCVTCRCDGSLQVWRVEDGSLQALLNLDTKCTCIACPLSCKLAVVGTATGHLCMISLADPSSPRLIDKRFIHTQSVTSIKYDQAGLYMASFSADDPIFFCDSRPSSKFEILGYIDVSERILDISLLSLERGEGEGSGYVKVAILSCGDDKLRKLTHFQLKNSFLDKAPPELYEDDSREFSSHFIQRKVAVIPEHISELITLHGGVGFSFLDTKLAQFCLPKSHHEMVQMRYFYEGHDLKGGKMAISFHRKWLASTAQDGKLVLRFVENPSGTVTSTPHHYKQAGCHGVVFTRDSQSLLTIGDSGFITCWSIVLSSFGTQKSSGAAIHFRNVIRTMEPSHTSEDTFMTSLPPFTSMESQPEKTWFMIVKEEARTAEDELYTKTKAELRDKIGGIRNKLLNMISANEELPEMEKLGCQAFILDTEEHRLMLVEEQIQIQQVKEEVELSILATRYLREQIKQECWDKMSVKGKTVKAFQGSLEVSNYPMIAHSKDQMNELERVTYLARIDAVDRKLRKEIGQELKQSLQPQRQDEMYEDEDYLGNLKDKPMQANELDDQDYPDALLGSHRALYGVECNLLASQFELHSAVYKRHQIVLLEDCIYRLKECFNKEFDDVVRMKVNEIARFRERNVRISKIISQLKLEELLVQPSLSDSEQSEKILIVEDREITIKKYISHEEKTRLEEQAQHEEERRLVSMGDNSRERALDMMMRGRLEADMEEDLFKDMQKPDFMSKDPAEISEDELRMAREFEKKEEALLEEREKMKKALETELRKLQSSITQGMEQYDDRLQKLFQLKVHTQTTIHQEELKVLHLARSLFIEKEVRMKEEEINNILEDKKIKKVQLGTIISNSKRKIEEVKESYELQAAEDKEIDRLFKREFADCEPYVDLLYKFFKKRSRGPRPSICGASMRRRDSRVRGGLRVSVVELDHAFHMPEGLDAATWDRLVAYRHKKIESENKMKAASLDLAEMNTFLQRKQVEEDRVQQDIQNTFKDLSKLQEDKMVFELNLEIQFLLKQGQVEVSMGDFIPDFSDTVLIHRSHIEELNSQIKTLGEAKINSMLECKDFKRGIRMLEWERQKMQLEGEDLQDQAKDIQQLRVTKDLLQRLMENDLLSKDAKQKETLDRTLELNRNSLHRTLKGKRKVLRDLDKQVKANKEENRELDQRLRKLQVSVAECNILEELAGVPRSEANREQKMKEIVTRRKLVEKIKSQDAEYADLKMEIERLYMKTFPALVQMN